MPGNDIAVSGFPSQFIPLDAGGNDDKKIWAIKTYKDKNLFCEIYQGLVYCFLEHSKWFCATDI
jgi:hypothetical protein